MSDLHPDPLSRSIDLAAKGSEALPEVPGFKDIETTFAPYVRELTADPQWNLLRTLAWIKARDDEQAEALYLWARSSLTTALRHEPLYEAWIKLRLQLRLGHITARGRLRLCEPHVAIKKEAWIDCEPRRQGAAIVFAAALASPFSSPVLYDARFFCGDVRKNWPPVTAAAAVTASMIDSETRAERDLKRIMQADPTRPIPKSELKKRPEFSGVSHHGFARAYRKASDAVAPAWTAPGRRPTANKTTRSIDTPT